MKTFYSILVAIALLTLPACERGLDSNQPDGVKDAVGARPYEGVRDSAEDAGSAVKDAGQDVKDAVSGS